MSLLLWAALLAIMLAGGFIVGLTSFGGNLFAIPLMALLISPMDAIAVGCISCIPILLAVGLVYWRHLPWADILLLSLSAAPATLGGAWLLANLGERSLLFCAGGAVIVFLAWQVLSSRLTQRPDMVPRWASIPCGLAAGVMAASTGMGGPPLVFYAYCRGWNKEASIGGCSMANAFQMIASAPAQWAAGIYSIHLANIALWGAVAAIFGLLLSIPVLKRINLGLFRKIILAMLALSAFNLFIRGLMA